MRTSILLLSLLFFSSHLFSQTIEITKNDAVIINHTFDQNKRLREISRQKDSLIMSLQEASFEKSQVISKQMIQLRKHGVVLQERDSIEANYQKMIEQYEKNRLLLEKDIRRERRKKRFWKYFGVVAVTASATAILLK